MIGLFKGVIYTEERILKDTNCFLHTSLIVSIDFWNQFEQLIH